VQVRGESRWTKLALHLAMEFRAGVEARRINIDDKGLCHSDNSSRDVPCVDSGHPTRSSAFATTLIYQARMHGLQSGKHPGDG